MPTYYHFKKRGDEQRPGRFFRIFTQGSLLAWVEGEVGETGSGEITRYKSEEELNKVRTLLISSRVSNFYDVVCAGGTEPVWCGLELMDLRDGPLTQSQCLEIDKEIQRARMSAMKGLFDVLESEEEGSEIIVIEEWENWSLGWEWAEKAKAELLKRPHYHYQAEDELALLLSPQEKRALERISLPLSGHGTFSLEGIKNPSSLIETAMKLWEPERGDSSYALLSDAFKAAGALI